MRKPLLAAVAALSTVQLARAIKRSGSRRSQARRLRAETAQRFGVPAGRVDVRWADRYALLAKLPPRPTGEGRWELRRESDGAVLAAESVQAGGRPKWQPATNQSYGPLRWYIDGAPVTDSFTYLAPRLG